MPTKKPAQPERRRVKRTDWKALAKHRGEALTVMADVQRAEQRHLNDATARATHAERVRDEYLQRALAAEKHNAILLAEREARDKVTVRKLPWCLICYRSGCDGSCVVNVASSEAACQRIHDRVAADHEPSPTFYRHLKSWAAKWSIEIALVLAILAVFAGASWYALRWGK